RARGGAGPPRGATAGGGAAAPRLALSIPGRPPQNGRGILRPSGPPAMPEALTILLEDNHCLALAKPAGLLTQGVPPGIPTLESLAKDYLKNKYHKAGNVYLGIPHRLDPPVSGVVLFARSSKAAARLAEQFQKRQGGKVYWARVEAASAGEPPPGEGGREGSRVKRAG